MGAEQFDERVKKSDYKTMQSAFDDLHERALYDFGHAGYTGTIAEKGDYRLILFPERLSAQEILDALDASYPVWIHGPKGMVLREGVAPEWAAEVRPSWDTVTKMHYDKWGPALAFETKDEYVFCGFASC